MNYACPHNDAILTSRPAYYLHLASEHGEYENGETVEGKTERKFDSVGRNVLKLLMEHPETRGSSNFWLWLKYKQYYSHSHILCYDANAKGWAINRPNGILKDEKDINEFFEGLRTCERRRQEYQTEDTNLYHIDKEGNPGILYGKLHRCILPSRKDQILAEEKESVMRRRYGYVGQAMLNEV